MTKQKLFLTILGGIGVAGSALVSAGIIPGGAAIAALFALLTGGAGLYHPTPAATAAFGAAAK